MRFLTEVPIRIRQVRHINGSLLFRVSRLVPGKSARVLGSFDRVGQKDLTLAMPKHQIVCLISRPRPIPVGHEATVYRGLPAISIFDSQDRQLRS